MAEVDTPGHARSWGLSERFGDITTCGEVAGRLYPAYCATPPCGQLNPAVNNTYTALRGVLTDVSTLFADAVVHLGYDAVSYTHLTLPTTPYV